jgi:hypothetical protein
MKGHNQHIHCQVHSPKARELEIQIVAPNSQNHNQAHHQQTRRMTELAPLSTEIQEEWFLKLSDWHESPFGLMDPSQTGSMRICPESGDDGSGNSLQSNSGKLDTIEQHIHHHGSR